MASERIVYSAVAVPGEPDSDGEILTPDEISHAAHAYMRDYRIVDPDHVCALGHCREVGKPVESYITNQPMSVKAFDNTLLEFPKGTWVVGIDVFDDDTFNQIKSGQKRGVSLTAKGADGVIKSRVLIRDLGPEWVARTVSIVDHPAVPKARFFLKGISDKMTEDMEDKTLTNGIDKLVSAIKSLKDKDEVEEEEVVAEEPIKSEEEVAINDDFQQEDENLNFVTHEELFDVRSELMDAVKSLKPSPEDEGKDLKIQELEAEIKELRERVTSTKSKAIPDHYTEPEVTKGYDDERDLYGRVIRK